MEYHLSNANALFNISPISNNERAHIEVEQDFTRNHPIATFDGYPHNLNDEEFINFIWSSRQRKELPLLLKGDMLTRTFLYSSPDPSAYWSSMNYNLHRSLTNQSVSSTYKSAITMIEYGNSMDMDIQIPEGDFFLHAQNFGREALVSIEKLGREAIKDQLSFFRKHPYAPLILGEFEMNMRVTKERIQKEQQFEVIPLFKNDITPNIWLLKRKGLFHHHISWFWYGGFGVNSL